MKFLTILFALISATCVAQTLTPADLAEQQLKGYNERNIELFLQPYSDSVKVFLFPGKLLYKGKQKMRNQYTAMFNNSPDLHCTIKSRIAIGNTVIDEENVIFRKDQPVVHAVAIYKIAHDKIQEVYFVMKE
jgi:hypothetical protein